MGEPTEEQQSELWIALNGHYEVLEKKVKLRILLLTILMRYIFKILNKQDNKVSKTPFEARKEAGPATYKHSY